MDEVKEDKVTGMEPWVFEGGDGLWAQVLHQETCAPVSWAGSKFGTDLDSAGQTLLMGDR